MSKGKSFGPWFIQTLWPAAAWGTAICLLAPSRAFGAQAIEPSAGDQRLLQSSDLSPSGAFATNFPFAAPPFHGNQPSLGLSYHSSRGNGIAGVGWTLAGFDTIQRRNEGKGVPRFDATDIYLLGGDRLYRCS